MEVKLHKIITLKGVVIYVTFLFSKTCCAVLFHIQYYHMYAEKQKQLA
jgi:hypothetical protein